MEFLNSNFDHNPKWIRGAGPFLYDSNNRKVFDAWLGAGTLLYGHQDEEYCSFTMLPNGMPLAIEDIHRIKKLVSFEISYIGFQSSGSGAVTRACRFARSLTGKNKIVVVGSFWHGSDGEFLFKTNKLSLSSGLPSEIFHDVIWIRSLDQLSSLGEFGNVAAVLVEPYQGADPSKSTLKAIEYGLREMLRDSNILLITDEIITGFKECYGSCQSSRSVDADIVVLGKAAALGYPIGIVLVNKRATDRFSCNNISKLFWGGTFSGTQAQIRRLLYSLKKLESYDYSKYASNLKTLTSRLRRNYFKKSSTLELREGPLFARICKREASTDARAFSEDGPGANYSELMAQMTDATNIFVAANGLVFGSCYDIDETMPLADVSN